MIIDTHLHVIDRTALHYPWLAGVPALDRDFPYETYRREAERVGIAQALHMEVDVDPADIDAETRYVAGLEKRPESLIVGAIAACRPEDPGFDATLAAAKADPLVKGLRRVLHVMPDELSEAPAFRANIARLAGSGLTFDFCVLPRQIGRAAALADLAPGATFVLDHCGVPDIRSGDAAAWRAAITDIARRPNVTAKISGVVAYADPADWTVATLRPYVEHTIESFGWDRVVWGSDWPVCTLGGGLSAWVAATHALLEGVSADERAALLSGNAKRLWRL